MELIKTPKIENVRMLDRYNAKKPSVGTLYLTATHLIFVDPDGKKETWILHMHVGIVEKLPLTTTGSPMQIRCKTFLSVTFIIPKERDCHEIFTALRNRNRNCVQVLVKKGIEDTGTSLRQLSQPAHIEDLYCFHYTASNEDLPKPAGWNFFDIQAEFLRMRVPNDQWTLTLLNSDYELCDTYPRPLYVPSTASTTVLLGSSRFRSKGRLPVLTYLHTNKAAICRCSQPLSGFSARCLEDEQMLNCILRTNPNATYMYVVDTRPRINAMANRAAGKGYENENFYENIKFHFLGIENIHAMRGSLSKLIETCELKSPTMSSFLNGLESSGWLKHVRSVLDTSWFIAQAVQSGVSVVVHCSDGWDRTAQVCATASLLLDPYYRTVHGFQALIEKDWLSFGHKFSERCGHIATDPKEISPVFTQFIDSTWQLSQQFPAAFQFNERFLLNLHDQVQACQFGTFVGNCEKDRVDLRLSERTFSLWGYMANHTHEYVNPLFKPSEEAVLKPSLAPQNVRFWRGMYCRFESGVHPRESLSDLLLATCDHSASLEDHVKLLTKRITLLKEQLAKVNKVKLEQDNKYVYEKEPGAEKLSPLPNGLTETLSMKQLTSELASVALDWKTLRNVRECACSTPFDHFSRKYHCWRCGEVFCTRCIDKHTTLPGHLSQRAVPVCRPCYLSTLRSNSIESP